MTWVRADEAEATSQAYLRILAKIEAGELAPLPDVEGNDREGRVTGAYRCPFCGMRSNDPDYPETCCKPAFRAAGLLRDGYE